MWTFKTAGNDGIINIHSYLEHHSIDLYLYDVWLRKNINRNIYITIL